MKAQKRLKAEDVRHEVFRQLLDLLWGYHGEALKDLADEAGMHWTTIYAWQRGLTYAPRIDKIAAVAAVVGYRLELKISSATPVLRRVK